METLKRAKQEITSSRQFGYSEPTSPINKPGFIGAFWGDVKCPINTLLVRGVNQDVQVFGFQALRYTENRPALIDIHPERELTELTYPIQGQMNMTIQTPHENDVVSHMMGVVPMGADLHGAHFYINTEGELIIHLANNIEYVSFPTVTPVGSMHGTTPITDECIYLAVKTKKEAI